MGAETFVLVADQLLAVALPLYILDRTGDPALTAALSLARVLPSALLGAIGGTVVDRADRRRLLVRTALARSVLAAGLLLAVVLAAPILAVFSLVVGLACLAPLSGPAVGASLPAVVSEQDLPRANAQLAARSVLLRLGAPTAGAVLYAAAGLGAVVGVDAALYAVAALVWHLTSLATPTASPGNRFLLETVEGFRIVRNDPLLARLLSALALGLVGLSLELAVLVPFVRTELHGSHAAVGYLTSVEAAGALAASLVFPQLHRRLGTVRVLTLGVAGLPLATLGFVASQGVASAVPGVLGAGVGLTLLTAGVQVHMQTSVPAQLLGRVLGVIGSAIGVSAVLGSGLALALCTTLSLRHCLLVAVALELSGVVAYVGGSVRRLRQRTGAQAEPVAVH